MQLTDMLQPKSVNTKGDKAFSSPETDADTTADSAESGQNVFEELVADITNPARPGTSLSSGRTQQGNDPGLVLAEVRDAGESGATDPGQAGRDQDLGLIADHQGQAKTGSDKDLLIRQNAGLPAYDDAAEMPPSKPSSVAKIQEPPVVNLAGASGQRPAQSPPLEARPTSAGPDDVPLQATMRDHAAKSGNDARQPTTPTTNPVLTPEPAQSKQTAGAEQPSLAKLEETPLQATIRSTSATTKETGRIQLPIDQSVKASSGSASPVQQSTQSAALQGVSRKIDRTASTIRAAPPEDPRTNERSNRQEVRLLRSADPQPQLSEQFAESVPLPKPFARTSLYDHTQRATVQAASSPTTQESGIVASQTHSQSVTKLDAMPAAVQNTSPVGSEVARQIVSASLARRDVGVLEVMLDPPELGRIEIAIELGEQGLRATLSAERSSTTDLIRRHLDVLGEQFSDAGFDLEDLNLSDDRRDEEAEAPTSSIMQAEENHATATGVVATGGRTLLTSDSIDIRL